MSDDEFRKLKIEVLECVKELKETGGPAAGRFNAKLLHLIDGITKSKADQILSLERIDTFGVELNETKFKLADINQKVAVSEEKIASSRKVVEETDHLAEKLDIATKTRNQKVS